MEGSNTMKTAKTSTKKVASVNVNLYSNINKEHPRKSSYTISQLTRQTRQGSTVTININITSKGEKEVEAAISNMRDVFKETWNLI